MLDQAIKTLKEIDISIYQEELKTLETESNKILKDEGYSSDKYIASLKRTTLLNEIVELFLNANSVIREIEDTQMLLNDGQFKAIAEEDINTNITKLNAIIFRLVTLTRKKLPHDDKKAIVEIRPGVGGVEASLFAESIFNMYRRYCDIKHFKIEMYSLEHNNEGGITEATFLIDESDSFEFFRFESGVHRVQRVPTTESAGRIHTSTVAVAVLPKFEQSEVKISEKDIRIDVYRSSGPGGQSVNTTDSAVRVTHLPTGIIVTSQNSRSQIKNKEIALNILYSKLQDIEMQKQLEEELAIRKEAISSSDRSMKIRTYNFPQSRVTDHRVNISWFNINEIIMGDIDEVLNSVSNELRK